VTVVHEPRAEVAHPRPIPPAVLGACGLLVLAGVVAFALGLGSDADTAWRAYHVNFLFFSSLAQGGVVISCIFVTVGARWPGPVRRFAESISAFVPVAFVLALIGFLGRDHIYPWIENPIPVKEAWLNVPRLVITDVVLLGLLTAFTVRYLYLSIRPTLEHAVEDDSGSLAARFTRGWRGLEAEKEASQSSMRRMAPALLLLFAVGYSVIGFDQVMSLSPMWFSNLFGAYFAWGGFLSAVSATALLTVLNRTTPGLETAITPGRMHDIGKMVFAFSIFWMYLFWSQYLPIWYGNLPEETFFLEARLGTQFFQDTWNIDWSRLNEPWVRLTLTAWVGCWVVPFWVLLGQRPKRTPWILGSVAVIQLIGFWIERNVLVWPSFSPDDPMVWAGAIQFGIAAGFAGLFLLSYFAYSRVLPATAIPQDG